jgi:RNA-directed DNA polymerase
MLVATLDVKDFFPTTDSSLVEPVFDEAGSIDEALSDAIAMTMLDGALPQGSPTSSLLANLAFLPADRRLRSVCRKRGLTYTRYVDDIAVSGSYDFRELHGPFIKSIEQCGYRVATGKVKFQFDDERQIVTGLVVNDRLRPTKDFLRDLKHEIRLCLEFGAAQIAHAQGVPVLSLKSTLTGRVTHVTQSDTKLGNHLRGMLYGINWRTQSLPECAPNGWVLDLVECTDAMTFPEETLA